MTLDSWEANGVLYAVARATPDITGLVHSVESRDSMRRERPSARESFLVPGEEITSSVFLPSGTDVRGFLLSRPTAMRHTSFIATHQM